MTRHAEKMRRRSFLGLAALASLGGASRGLFAQGNAAQTASDEPELAVDPYFLEPGNLSETEHANIQEYEAYLDVNARGGTAIMPRSGRPRWAPTYRLVHWPGEAGDPDGKFVGSLGVEPEFEPGRAYRLNAQILEFNTSSRQFRKNSKGTLTVEIRARQRGEALTWLFAEQFQCFGSVTSLGKSYIAERNELPEPVIMDEPNLDVRIQLMRHRKSPGLLRKILNIASFVATGGATGVVNELVPSIRVPQLVQEGVALSQAVFGGMTDEKPLWLSGFNSYSVSSAGSRMRLRPGYWVVIDETIPFNLDEVKLQDAGGRISLTRNGQPIDVTYLVLWLEVEPGSMSRQGERIIEKSVPRQ